MRRKSYNGRRKRTPGEPSLRCGFTEDDIREKFAQEEQWEDLSDQGRLEAIQSLMDASEYDHVAKLADEAIAEAVARYLHDTIIEKEQGQDESDLT